MITTRSVDTEVEKRIVVGCVTSDIFLKEIGQIIKPDYFKNEFARTVTYWCLEYFNDYEKAPQKHIQDIFEVEKSTVPEADRQIISTMLTKLSKQHEDNPALNIDYLLDQAIAYFKKRGLQIVSENVSLLLSLNKVADAEKQLIGYTELVRMTSGWENPFLMDPIIDAFDESKKGIFSFPGALGDFIGEVERGWFFAVMGPMKRGKTWWLLEAATQGILLGLRVVFISLEMKNRNINQRLYKRITSFAPKEGFSFYPAFDCLLNQKNECARPERTCKVRLLDELGAEPINPVHAPEGYQVCDYCRKSSNYEVNPYVKAQWYISKQREAFDFYHTASMVKAFTEAFGDNLRVRAYPKFSANVKDIIHDLDVLEMTESFSADMIVIDYADILAPEDARITGRDRIDETWKTLGRLAETRHVVLFSGTQSNRISIEQASVKQTHTGEDIRKLAHVDAMFTLNQTEWEKMMNIMRIGLIAHRHMDTKVGYEVEVLQSLEHGQPHLDSHKILMLEHKPNTGEEEE